MKVKTKLYLGFGFILIILLVLASYMLFTLNQQHKFMEEIVQENYERVKLVNSLKSDTQVTGREIRELLLLDNKAEIEKKIPEILALREQASATIDSLLLVPSLNPETREILISLRSYNQSYSDYIDSIINEVSNGTTESARQLLIDDSTNIRQIIITEIDDFTAHEEELMNQSLQESEQAYEVALSALTIIIIVSIALVLVVSVSVVKSISTSINKVRQVMTKVSNIKDGNFPRVEVNSKDEIGEIGLAYNEMATSLETSFKHEKELKESLQDENWIKTKHTELAIEFQGIQDLEEFGQQFLSKVSPLVQASYSAFYVTNGSGTMNRVAAYAGNGEELPQVKFDIGEGLVGQCAKDKKILSFDTLPSNYIVTKSGLGQANPTTLLLLPIEFEGDIYGVLEIAKFEPFTPIEHRLLQQVCETSGSSIDRILDHMRIEELLSESQTLTEELQTQSEELQQQQEELRLINEQLHEQYKQSDDKTKELQRIKEDLEEKNRGIKLSSKYKSEFLANMSHELRTPLNSMLILSQMLAQNTDGNLSEKQIEHAHTIYSSGTDLLNLINDILDLSKIESGKFEVYPEEVLLNDIEAFVKRQFLPVSRHKGVYFSIDVHSDAPSILFTDDQRLKQILKNLLSNAFKFTNEGGVTLRISKGLDNDSRSKIKFTVIDTGIGIANDKLESIFEAFYQSDGTTSRKYGGTGLGLSICKDLASRLGGFIEVESTEGQGSSFTLHLPDFEGLPGLTSSDIEVAVSEEIAVEEEVEKEVEDENVVAEETKEESKHLLENKVVLVVDDDMRNVFALTTALESQKMDVLFAENGKEAIHMLENNTSIDIVLMDIMMPEMNGFDAMREIRKKEEFEQLPIIALTAKAMKTDKEKCINAGASDYISKPVNIEQLVSLIKVWLYNEGERHC
ncbi:sensor histidine kinase [Alkalihalobacterium bogoriense]|uniref:sensor histidine kinase n=1 Tax=Alkalihalobacterium bogoriense TaxID=246272 RepID=UPI00047A3949|nr:ATP-binding protein [Alkalihalobacterium bogoriense]